MTIDELLSTIRKIAAEHNLSTPYIVGGTPRDRIMQKEGRKIKDIDLTTGDESIKQLSKLLADQIPDAKYRDYDDGHSSVDVQSLRIDFSNHFVIDGIENVLRKMGISDITEMKKELYSRDFTMNTLLEDLEFNNVYDLTGEGIADIKAHILKCPIDPDITIGVDARRILRALYFSLKYGFNLEDDLKRAILKHRENIKNLPLQFVQHKMQDIVEINEDKGIDLLIKYRLLHLVDLNQPLYDILIKHKKLTRAI